MRRSICSPTHVFRFVSLWVIGFAVLASSTTQADEQVQRERSFDVQAIYKEKCLRCHGDHGQGTSEGYSKPLDTSQSVEALTKVIAETMPEEDPESCVGEEAKALAHFILETFEGSKGELNSPGITRLTVAQYRNSIADLLGQFTPQPSNENQTDRRRRSRRDGNGVPGLRGEYYQSEGMNKAQRLAHYRSDTRIDFDFGRDAPVPSLTADQFAIIWQGSLRADHTGEYAFRLTTQNGARLYLNFDPRPNTGSLRDDRSSGDNEAFIDDWVGSGKVRTKSASMFLLGGRDYPIRLEFFKYLEDAAQIKLEWKPPHGTWSVLDFNHVTTESSPRTYACDVPFPADDRSLGFERGSHVSPQWQSAVMAGAVQTAAEVISRLPLLSGTAESGDRDEKILRFVQRFAEVAFRRTIEPEEAELLRSITLANPDDLESGVRKSVVLILMSPHFLYPDLTSLGDEPSQLVVASRLSFAMWDSIPDAELIEAAKAGKLNQREGIEDQARRMLQDPRAKAKIRRFFGLWLEIEERDLSKDRALFPEFDEQVVADLRRSLELFIDSVVWSRRSDYRELLLADHLMLNERLSELYFERQNDSDGKLSGEEIKQRAREREFASSFQPVDFDAAERSGILTHPYLLSVLAYHNNTSPIHRGVFLTRNIVGRALSPPPNAIAFKDDEFPDDLTMREKVTLLTQDSACMSCHSVINPLGFTLESYDAVGRWRVSENEKPIDTESNYVTQSGEVLKLGSARDVAEFAVKSPSAHRAFITHLYEHMLQQSAHEAGEEQLEQLTQSFAADDFNIQKLCARLAVLATQKASPRSNHLTENSQ
ncbi:DUF1592 domain-containing protein [Stieleria sp. JC731]|uniref:DUF1592 domain-containing protein n=1 Tax=Pirellulaceae TaxID=2691357 RepID=UPI001E4F284C|nr:DUF1592 domain-containing protein [Stieleria sp. JC731]MCC9603162.1 DUF1592 domain-containing protein [Stieleria sp. JC731]